MNLLKNIIVIAFVLITQSMLFSQDCASLSGIVNTYAPVTNIVGNVVTVGATSGATAPFAIGDNVVLIQMTGVAPIQSGSNMGKYELTTITAVSGSNITLSSVTNTYTFSTQKVQLVRVPNCTAATISATVTAKIWDGTTGGIIALKGTTLTMNANIDATGTGFSQANPPTLTFSNSLSTGQGSTSGRGFNGIPNNPGVEALGGGGIGGGGGLTGGSDAIISGGGKGGSGRRTNTLGFGYGTGGGFGTNMGSNPAWGTGGGGGGGVIGGGGGGGAVSNSGAGGGVDGGGGGGDGIYGGGGGGGTMGVGNGVSPTFPDSGGGSGGGSYGGGAGAASAHAGGDDASGGGGGGSWTGGGCGGLFGTTTPGYTGGKGNDAVTTVIPNTAHFLNTTQPRLMMGGAGGDGSVGKGEIGGFGGGIVIMQFSSVTGNSFAIRSNGQDGDDGDLIAGQNQGEGGAGGGGGGQMSLHVDTWSGTTVTVNGGQGGDGAAGYTTNIGGNVAHGGVGGGGGGAGGIWLKSATTSSNTGGQTISITGLTRGATGGTYGASTLNPKNGKTTGTGGCGGNGLIIASPDVPSWPASFDLALVKKLATGQTSPVTAGDLVSFEITVYNQGGVDASGISVKDYINTTMFEAFSAADNPDGNTSVTVLPYTWDAATAKATITGTLPAGASLQLPIKLRVKAGAPEGYLVNKSEIASATGGIDFDSTPDDTDGNQPGEVSPVLIDDNVFGDGKSTPPGDEDDHDIALILGPNFDLALDKKLGPGQLSTVLQGSVVNYLITVYNQGTVDASAITIKDYFTVSTSQFTAFSSALNPSGTTGGDATLPYTWDAATATATITGVLPAGKKLTIPVSLQLSATSGSGTKVNTAEISSAKDGSGNTVTDFDSTPDATSGNQGGETGAALVNDKIDGNGKATPVQDEDDHDFENVTSATNIFDLALDKKLAAGQSAYVAAGDLVNFEITVYNQGTSAATSITIKDYINTAMFDAFSATDNPNGTTTGDVAYPYTWTAASTRISVTGSLAANQKMIIPVKLRVKAGATGTLTNKAEIRSSSGGTDVDSTPGDVDGDQPGEVAPILVDDQISGKGKATPVEDEDDHDIANVTVGNPCAVSLTALPSACNPLNNQYSVSGNITFSNPPSTGTMTVSIGALTQVFNAPFTSPQAYTLSGLTADGASHTASVVFSADAICTSSTNYTAPANCTPAPCAVSLTALPSACNPLNNQYSVSGNITFSNPPSTGTMTVSIGALTQVFNAPFTSPQAYTLSGLTADGASHTASVVFSADAICTSSTNYTAPANCTPAPCSVSLTALPSACNPLNNQYSVSGNITFSNPPSTGTMTVSIGAVTQVFNAPFTSPQAYTLSGLTADGASHTASVVFSADAICTSSTNYTAPANCTPAPCSVSLTALPSACNPLNNQYSVSGNITFSNPPSTGTMTVSIGAVTQVFNAPFTSPQAYTLSGLTADGASHTASVVFSADAACTNTASYTAPVGCTIPVCAVSVTAVPGSCNGTNNQYFISGMLTFSNPPASGSVVITVSGGGSQIFTLPQSSPLNYTINGLIADGAVHTVAVTFSNAAGCTNTVNYAAPAACNTPCPPSNYSMCVGQSYTLTAPTGYSGYQWYTVSGMSETPVAGGNSNTLVVTSAGTYIWKATDGTSCPIELCCPVTIEVTMPTVNCTIVSQPGCGQSNGSVNVSASGGNGGPYTYVWSTTPAQTAATATGLAAGTYTVTVSDAGMCTAVCDVTLSNPSSPVAVCSNSAPGCGLTNGTATATPSGGLAPYTYTWNTTPIQNSQTAVNLPAGTYTVTVADANNCKTTCATTINAPIGCCVISDLAIIIGTCDNKGTTTDGSDDEYTFTLNPTGSGIGASYTVTGLPNSPQTGTYGSPTTFGPYLISAGAFSIAVVDDVTNTCSKVGVVNPPPSCSGCTVAPPVLTVTDNVCPSRTGSISIVQDCGAGSYLEYSTNNGLTWSTAKPLYTTTAKTILARCVNSADASCKSTHTTVTTNPQKCPGGVLVCTLIASATAGACQDNATADVVADDYFMIQVNASASNAGSTKKYEVVLGADPTSGLGGNILNSGGTMYGSPVTVGQNKQFKADGSSAYTLIVRDIDSKSCLQVINITAVPSCSALPPKSPCYPVPCVPIGLQKN